MNRYQINGRTMGNGIPLPVIEGAVVTRLGISPSVIASKRVNGSVLGSLNLNTTNATATVKTIVYGAVSTNLKLAHTATATVKKIFAAATSLKITGEPTFGLKWFGQAATPMRLVLTADNVVVFGLDAPEERQITVQYEDRTMVV